jgi:carboxyl-terminal processing protease
MSGPRRRAAAVAAVVVLALAPCRHAAAARAPSPQSSAASHDLRAMKLLGLSGLLQLAELDVSFDTLLAQYYRDVNHQSLLDGAHTGVVAHLRARGIADPRVPLPHASGNYAHDLRELDRQIYEALIRYGGRVDVRSMIHLAIAGELASLNDPYTQFFTPAQYHAFTTFLRGRVVGGIGVVILHEGGRARIDRVFAGSPALRAGLQPGDEIAAIDGVSLSGLSSDAIGERMHGAVGSVVRLSIVRAGSALPAAIPIVRAEIHIPDVDGRLLAGGVGYVQLASYGESAAKDLAAVLQRLGSQGARAYVLDLRDDGGGYRHIAIAVTSKFVASGPIVTVQDRRGRRSTLVADGSAFSPKPLVVLVNGNTASAAEITAAAIQDVGRGTLVGQRTYGKGLVQQIFPLPDGAAMKITTERYVTARGHDIDRKGIAPDVAVDQPAGSFAGEPGNDPQLDRALALLAAQPAPTTQP